jgi:TetR/AcrR family transcriptional regulator, regulator of autoinduction and epiphytic fitness
MPRLAFQEEVLRLREDAILTAVNRLLADKGFDLMTVDEVAARVGIAKASLYKHFPSKEALAAAAMARLLHRALDAVDQQAARAEATPVQRIEAVVRWALTQQLAGEMPTLPSQNSTLREELLGHRGYMDALMRLSDRLGGWIEAAQAAGELDPELPAELILFSIYARACDPVPAFLKAGGRFDHEQIVDLVTRTCLDGLKRR